MDENDEQAPHSGWEWREKSTRAAAVDILFTENFITNLLGQNRLNSFEVCHSIPMGTYNSRIAIQTSLINVEWFQWHQFWSRDINATSCIMKYIQLHLLDAVNSQYIRVQIHLGLKHPNHLLLPQTNWMSRRISCPKAGFCPFSTWKYELTFS